MEIALKQLKALLKTLEEGGVSEFEYQDEKYRLRLKVGSASAPLLPAATAAPAAPAPAVAPPPPAAAPADDPNIVYLTSPFVGTFYRSPSPEADPFVQLGSTVRKGQALCIIEAMKLMNEIESEFDGTVVEILVENGQSVEFGQKLFKLKKT
ncbi:MAG TPA: acetyl-CoA carboxylase biotin carboxyl carrier protein [Polyangiaceae bacterium]|nr:acetyl-CoA carboxylase biotin carboxyl carrier protein [Polyangiaceae bacterium]